MKSMRERGESSSSVGHDGEFVVADPHHVYYDAIMHSPWNHDGGGHLPEKDDWSTYRYTVKDIILGVATHRFNKNSRRLEIRAYFTGEHPIFKELETTRAMMIVFCCQSYQSGGSLEIYFEHGLPFDVREMIERRLGIRISGHERLLEESITRKLFAELSNFPPEIQKMITEQKIPIETVCYNTYRGIWSSNQIRSLLQNRIPLRWLFKQRPDPLNNPLLYAYLIDHLRASALEQYAVYRLEDRQFGESLGRHISRIDYADQAYYQSEEIISVTDESSVEIPADTRFSIIPVIPNSSMSIYYNFQTYLNRVVNARSISLQILAFPMDFIYLPEPLRAECVNRARQEGIQLLVVGITSDQLFHEVELHLTVTAQTESDEMDFINVDRYPD